MSRRVRWLSRNRPMGDAALTVRIALDKDHETDFAAVFADRKAADKNLTKEDVLLGWFTDKAEELGEKAWRGLRRQRVLPIGARGEAVYYVKFEDLQDVPDGVPGAEGIEVDIPDLLLPALRRAASFFIAQAKAQGSNVAFESIQGFCTVLSAEKVDEAASALWKKKVDADRAERRKDREEAQKDAEKKA